jgi:hypothetical protein
MSGRRYLRPEDVTLGEVYPFYVGRRGAFDLELGVVTTTTSDKPRLGKLLRMHPSGNDWGCLMLTANGERYMWVSLRALSFKPEHASPERSSSPCGRCRLEAQDRKDGEAIRSLREKIRRQEAKNLSERLVLEGRQRAKLRELTGNLRLV